MAKSDDLDTKLKEIQNTAALHDNLPLKPDLYKPNKRNRQIRRHVYERFYDLRDDPLRKEAEAEWEIADKEFTMHFEPRDPDDWRPNLHLPDAFAAIQTQEQERIERKSRPMLEVEDDEGTDEPVAELGNAVMDYNMDNTGFDFQYYLSKLSGASRGTWAMRDYWRTEKRIVKDPYAVDKEGKILYRDKEITDFDDDYAEWMRLEDVFPDERAKHQDEMVDWVRREILNIDIFHQVYEGKRGFFDTDKVRKGGDTSSRSVFRIPRDITGQDVEILHYENRLLDAHWVVANNVVICDSPLQTKHKELSLILGYQYKVPGKIWGIGIPKIIHYLSEERRSLRNLALQRQMIIVSGAFLHNTAFDLDDEDINGLEPGKFIGVETNGQPLSAAIQQVNMGDNPASSFKFEEILLEDQRRGTGIDDRIAVSNSATTATQAAIVKESTLKRINMVSIVAEMDAIIRLGRIKWSNLQFFSPIPRIEKIVEDEQEKEQKKFRTISVKGKKFGVVEENGQKKLRVEDIRGKSPLKLDKEMAGYLDRSFNVTMNSDAVPPPSKAIEQTKKTELWGILASNPASLAVMDLNGSVADLLKVNNIDPDIWMKNKDAGKQDMQMLAASENMVMSAGQPLAGTEGATEEHTMIHLQYAQSAEFQALPPPHQQIIMDHFMQEHDNNPATGSAADLLGAFGMGDPAAEGGAGAAGGLAAVPPPTLQADTGQPQMQSADLQPTNFSQPE